jgi:hypothetical protein
MFKKLRQLLTKLLIKLTLLDLPQVVHVVHHNGSSPFAIYPPFPVTASPFAFLAEPSDIPMEDRLFIDDSRLINYIPNASDQKH